MKLAVKKKNLFSKLVLIFFIGCLAGYLYEEIFYLIDDGYLTNRGYLYGPYLPVYGFGAMFIYLFLDRFKKNPISIFLLSMFLTGVVEYVTGFWMYEIYHQRWWDYTGLFLNIDGYVCLRSVLTFAIAALALIYYFVPLIGKFIKKTGYKNSFNISIIICAVMIIDFICTVLFRY